MNNSSQKPTYVFRIGSISIVTLFFYGKQSTDCSCSGGPGYIQSCGTGIDVIAYDSCYSGFDRGYELCINNRRAIGTRWDCSSQASWSNIVACAAQAAACSVACASSVAHAGILCVACIAHYLADCTGCGFYTCTKTNVQTVKRSVRTAASGVCDTTGNTGR
jgi:hypothetical protein